MGLLAGFLLRRLRGRGAWLTRHPLRALALGTTAAIIIVTITQPTTAHALSLPGIGSVGLNPSSLITGAFTSLIDFLFGSTLAKLASGFVLALLKVPNITDPRAFGALNRYHDLVQGAGWGLMVLGFTTAVMSYWASSYTSSGATAAAQGFARTIGAIALLITFPMLLGQLTTLVDLVTHGLIANPVVGHNLEATIAATLTGALLKGGGITLILGIVGVVLALVLLLVKVIITALLAILFVLSPLAIGVAAFEPLGWAMRTLVQAVLALLIFPVLWAACFGVFATMTGDALLGGVGLGGDVMHALVGVAALVIAFKLPFAVMRIATSSGLMPSGGRAVSTAYHARALLRGGA